MKPIELEELLVKELLEVGHRVYQAALDERTPGAVLASVIGADGHVYPNQYLHAHRMMTRLDSVEGNRVGDEESLNPLEAEWDRLINTAYDVWGQNEQRRIPLR